VLQSSEDVDFLVEILHTSIGSLRPAAVTSSSLVALPVSRGSKHLFAPGACITLMATKILVLEGASWGRRENALSSCVLEQ
jgi:hypothetical protein